LSSGRPREEFRFEASLIPASEVGQRLHKLDVPSCQRNKLYKLHSAP
jgi:hypothetical protein